MQSEMPDNTADESSNGRHDSGPSNGSPPAERPVLTSVHLQNFTAFTDFKMDFSPGVNAIIGENATGKTHLLKVLYVACEVDRELSPYPETFLSQLPSYYYTTRRGRWNLIHRDSPDDTATIQIKSSLGPMRWTISGAEVASGWHLDVSSDEFDIPCQIPSVFIPAKEMLAHKPKFLSNWINGGIYFEKHYVDFLSKCDLESRLEPEPEVGHALRIATMAVGGTIEEINEVLHLVKDDWQLEFSLVAEGKRKLAALWLLLRNGSLRPGTVLFWDEPEANLNPQLMDEAVDIILELSRIGVQIFFATHSYVMLKELDLRTKSYHQVMYHSLYREKPDGPIQCESADNFLKLQNDSILAKYDDLLDRHLSRELEEEHAVD